jgi:hypothetical protein
MFSWPTQEAKQLAYKAMTDSMEERRPKLTRARDLEYLYGCNQAEWELLLFSRGFSAALQWLDEKGMIKYDETTE